MQKSKTHLGTTHGGGGALSLSQPWAWYHITPFTVPPNNTSNTLSHFHGVTARVIPIRSRMKTKCSANGTASFVAVARMNSIRHATNGLARTYLFFTESDRYLLPWSVSVLSSGCSRCSRCRMCSRCKRNNSVAEAHLIFCRTSPKFHRRLLPFAALNKKDRQNRRIVAVWPSLNQ